MSNSTHPIIFGSPRLYIQGVGVLSRLPEAVGSLGTTPFVVVDAVVHERLATQLHLLGIREADIEIFNGECTAAEIDRLASRQHGDVIVGLGGGKAIDAAKGVAMARRLPIIVVPTAASNDAPTSRVVVVYDDQHRLSEGRFLPFNPDVLLVDTGIVAKAPPRLFAAGIGDAISKKFEVELSVKGHGVNMFGGRPSHTAMALADACYRQLREHGQAATEAVRKGCVTDEVERVVEANILLSGLAFESGGLAIAHSLTRGFAALPETVGTLHGEVVAFGLLTQLILEGRPDAEVQDLIGFYRSVSLPSTFRGVGLTDPDSVTLRGIATHSLTAQYIQRSSNVFSAASIVDAMIRADTMGRAPGFDQTVPVH
ncbi:glycerol dehydrogenase [Variovorax boronicumulans]|uniref:glycerol dehydrogenase n=1 Tax=Variovorax boronicumulans TaxID=436515 RepID=UPI001C56101B